MTVNAKKSPFLLHFQASFPLGDSCLLSTGQWTGREERYQELLLLRRFANLLAYVALDLRCSSLFSKDSFFSSSVLFS